MSPPQLSGYAPVSDVVRPVVIGLFHIFGNKPYLALFHTVHRRTDQLIHLYEPLLLYKRLYCGMTSVMCTYIMIFDPYQETQLIELLHYGFPCLVPVHTGVPAAVIVYRTVIIHYIYDGQVMPFPDLEVIRIMCRSDLYDTHAELHIHIVIGYHRHLSVHDRQHYLLADQLPVSFIIRIDSDCRITEHSLGTRGRKLQIIIGPDDLILDMP